MTASEEDVAVTVLVEVVVDVSVIEAGVWVAYSPKPAAATMIRTIVTAAKIVVETASLLSVVFIV